MPQESTGNDENSGNKVISKKRHRAKEPFFYEGEKYVSLGQCCEIYGINETSVRARAWRIHCTWEEAVKHFIEKSNADELKKIFVYKGKSSSICSPVNELYFFTKLENNLSSYSSRLI